MVRDNGVWIDDAEYVKQFEIIIGEFLKLKDPLFLNCVDVSIPPDSVFPGKLREFGEEVVRLRKKALNYSAVHSLNRAFTFIPERNPGVGRTLGITMLHV
jgi:hypothetical protein